MRTPKPAEAEADAAERKVYSKMKREERMGEVGLAEAGRR